MFNDCVMAIMLLTGDNDASAGCHIVAINLRTTVSGQVPVPYADIQYPKSLEFPCLPLACPTRVGSRGISGRLNPGLRFYKCTYEIHSESSYRRVELFTNDYQ